MLYFWDASSAVPWVENVSASVWKNGGGKVSVRWLPSPISTSNPTILFVSKQAVFVAWLRGRHALAEPVGDGGDYDEEEEDEEDEESLDSVYQALTGRSPFKASIGGDTEILVSDVLDETMEVMDDTFVGRNGRAVTSGA